MMFVNDLLNPAIRFGGCLVGDTPLTFAARERLRELCQQAKARGTTQKALAARIGEKPMWITNRLTGHSQIHADDVPRIAEAFRMDVCAFYGTPSREFLGEFSSPAEEPLSPEVLQLAADLIAAFRYLPDDSRNRLRALLESSKIDIETGQRILD